MKSKGTPAMFGSSERRSNARKKFACFARFRQADVGTAGPEWLCVTRDFSHNGIYFLADDHELRESMQLLLKFPYDDHSPGKNREYLVEVTRLTRISSLLQRRCGVGARLILKTPVKPQDSRLATDTALSKHELPDAASHVQIIDLYA
jgi:hypothetical protein